MTLTPFALACFALSALAAAGYGFYFLHRPAGLVRAVVKTAAVAALATGLALGGAHPMLVVALALSALGDFALAFNGLIALALGIFAFLLAQIIYVTIFFALWMLGQALDPLWPRLAALAVLAASVLGFLLWLWREPQTPRGRPHAYVAMIAGLAFGCLPVLSLPLIAAIPMGTIGNITPAFWMSAAAALIVLGIIVWMRRDIGPMKFAIMPYAVTITAMAALSLFGSWAAWPAMLGAALFVISDGVLAGELFKLAPDAPARRITSPIVWWTYYAAQCLLALGIILGARAMA